MKCCKECGADLREDSKVCPQCGAIVEEQKLGNDKKSNLYYYDNCLKKVKIIVNVLFIVSIIACVIVSIALLANGINEGTLLLLFGWIPIYLNYIINMALIGLAIDIKLMRNKMYNIPNDKLIKDFDINSRDFNIK